MCVRLNVDETKDNDIDNSDVCLVLVLVIDIFTSLSKKEHTHLDLADVEPCISGPKRPHDQVPLEEMKMDWHSCLDNKVGFNVKSWIKTSIVPGSVVVTKYLLQSGLWKYLNEQGFYIVRYGWTTCIENSRDLDESVASAISENHIIVAVVLSGNRNFEGRVHPLTRANYLASLPLVVAYALAGTPMSMVLPGVVGFELSGKLRDGVTATDLVLTVTQMLRKHGVVGKFVEFHGEGVGKISLADRATIANMSPEYGATMGFFPVDHFALQYLKLIGRSEETGFAIPKEVQNKVVKFSFHGQPAELNHGSVVIAAITSYTNTSNPSVMLGAGLAAKKVCELGLQVKSWIKTSLAPGDLDESVASTISENDIVAAAVLSGNRNFKGRVHPLTRVNYLASPPLVVAYALPGTALGLGGVLLPRFRDRNLLGANNSLEPSDWGKTLKLTMVYLQKTPFQGPVYP
ncbi:hypothetical protein TEA_014340 [Camellia sinensis var. sinensis]|uniref:Aconitase/3-isopropylmalate dehydratase large subunit alpha/beta/alpha domain-containing protein n=1 Tax=Camellia sinensis var. sinensis TaxID=542762 RepID=A0A4S4CZT5_CAMSN|nr:hypothetical protein TEA_014340 [Camellia sinensis var. sinensis]